MGSSGTSEDLFSDIMGITIDDSGYIYVSEFGNIRIKKLSDDGSYCTKRGIFGKDEGQFDWQYGITVNSAGKIFVFDSLNNRIQVFSPVLPATYNIFYLTRWRYSINNFKILEEKQLICDPVNDESGEFVLQRKNSGKALAFFDEKKYSGLVIGNKFNVSRTQKNELFIITVIIIFSLTSETIGSGKTHLSKTDNFGSYCIMDGDFQLTYKELPDSGNGGVGGIPLFETNSGCFISAVKF